MKPLLVLILLMVPHVVALGEPASDKVDLQFPTKVHLTASQLLQMEGSPDAIDKIIGQFVLLDVVVTIEREVPLVEIVFPKEAGDSAHPANPIHAHAHLISATTTASSLKKGNRLRIEGIVVDEGFGAYTIYLHQAWSIK
jgi:hypothetical protein